MKRYWLLKALRIAAVAAGAVAALGYLVMALWNAVVPSLTGWHALGFGQAIALLVLSRLLFGGFRGHGAWHFRQRMHERWQAMSPDERDRLRARIGSRCGRFAPPAADAS
jgi:hypothetical protein